MENLTLLEVNKPERLKETLNELINYKNTAAEIPNITAESIGLGNVDNTRDIDKPLSSAQKSYIDNLCNGKVDAKVFENAETQNGIVTGVHGDCFADVNTDEMALHVCVRSVYTGEIISDTVLPLKLASSLSRGLMSKEDVATLNDLVTKVTSMEGKASRYLFTASLSPSVSEIEAFVQSLGCLSPYSGIAVVVDKTYHVWHYYENDSIGWRDDGVDTVAQATNDTFGIVKGSLEQGKVYIENDGSMSLMGYDDLCSRVSNIEGTFQNVNILLGETDDFVIVT